MLASASSITCFSSYHITLLSLRIVHMDLIMCKTKPDHISAFKNVVLRPSITTLTYHFGILAIATTSSRKIPLAVQTSTGPALGGALICRDESQSHVGVKRVENGMFHAARMWSEILWWWAAWNENQELEGKWVYFLWLASRIYVWLDGLNIFNTLFCVPR